MKKRFVIALRNECGTYSVRAVNGDWVHSTEVNVAKQYDSDHDPDFIADLAAARQAQPNAKIAAALIID
jgi:hypothetical protein